MQGRTEGSLGRLAPYPMASLPREGLPTEREEDIFSDTDRSETTGSRRGLKKDVDT